MLAPAASPFWLFWPVAALAPGPAACCIGGGRDLHRRRTAHGEPEHAGERASERKSIIICRKSRTCRLRKCFRMAIINYGIQTLR